MMRLSMLNALTVLCLSAAAQAGVVLDGAATFPTAPESEVHSYFGDTTNETDVRSTQTLAQSFTVTSGFTLDKIVVRYEVGSAGQNLGIRLFPVSNVSDLTTAGADIINLTTTSPANMVGSATDVGHILEMDFTGADEAFLAAGGYALELSSSGFPFKWKYYRDVNLYPGGLFFQNGIPFNHTTEPGDTAMAVVAVPEPSTLALAALGLSGLLRRRRR